MRRLNTWGRCPVAKNAKAGMWFRLTVAHIQPLTPPRQGSAVQSGKRDGKQSRAGHCDHPHRLVANIELG